MNYLQAIKFIQSYYDMELGTAPSDSLTMTIESMKSLLDRLRNPQDGRATVHITGSKGKGSTSTMVASILQKSGQRTALYQSPHLHSYTERIQIDSTPISEQEFADGIASIRSEVEKENSSGTGPIVTFGILTALFFELARKHRVDWQVVEVGLGGTLDATNVCKSKEIAVITPISLEHTAILGSTPAEIAAQKAGIIITGSTAVLAPQRDRTVKAVIENRCNEVGAQLIDVAESYACKLVEANLQRQRCRIAGARRNLEIDLRLLGRHQINNAATAVAVADAISARQLSLSDQSIIDGIANAYLPGRLEILQRDPMIVVDGAHNAESASVLRDALKEQFHYQRCIFILGVNRDKEIGSILEALAPAADLVIATRSQNARSMNPNEIAQHKNISNRQTQVTSSLPEAMNEALAIAGKDDLICVTGSLYLVSEARAHLLEGNSRLLI
jgi:dihydrofolate synthase/folylpolyglutamate synthase